MSSLDQPTIVYQGPPRWTGNEWVNGDRFVLSGDGKGNLGVEIAGAVSGLERETVEYRYDEDVNTPGSMFTGSVAARRDIMATINILGTDPKDLRRNKRRWDRNHHNKQPGQLWFLTSDGSPRYLKAIKSDTAGTASLDKDPHLRSVYEGWDWGWTSNSPYFSGYEEVRTMPSISDRLYERHFYNESTAPTVYPKVVVYGPGEFEVDGGFSYGPLRLPAIGAGEVLRVNYSPTDRTVLKRRVDGTGDVVNMWSALNGQRPHMSLEPETHNTMTVKNVSPNQTPDQEPELSFIPLFSSWV